VIPKAFDVDLPMSKQSSRHSNEIPSGIKIGRHKGNLWVWPPGEGSPEISSPNPPLISLSIGIQLCIQFFVNKEID
jgi:hypothetical protein